MYFPLNIAKFLRTPFSQDTSGRLLLIFDILKVFLCFVMLSLCDIFSLARDIIFRYYSAVANVGATRCNCSVLDLELTGDRLVGLFNRLVMLRVGFGLFGELNNSILDELFCSLMLVFLRFALIDVFSSLQFFSLLNIHVTVDITKHKSILLLFFQYSLRILPLQLHYSPCYYEIINSVQNCYYLFTYYSHIHARDNKTIA